MNTQPEPERTEAPSTRAFDRRIGVQAQVALFAGLLWAVTIAGAGLLTGPQNWGAQSAWPWWAEIPAMLVIFALTEVFVVHLHIRGDAHTVSMVELPLALGMFFVNPLVVIAAHAFGGGMALVFHRRQPLLKLAFNTAVFALSAMVAIAVFRFLTPLNDQLTPADLLSAALALAIANLVSLSLILAVIVLSSGDQRPPALWAGVRFGVMTNLFTVSLAVIGVIVIDAQPVLSWLLAIPIGGIYLANWAYTTERRRHEGLDFLYKSTRLLQQSPELESAILELLRHAQATFSARHAELIYWNAEGLPLSLGVGLDGEVLADDEAVDHGELAALINGLAAARQCRAEDGAEGAFLSSRGFQDAIVAPLVYDDRSLGALIIADQLSDIRGFDANDLRLTETLANQTAIALENGHLEQSLDQLRILERRLSFQATHDPLTDLANRTLFRDNLSAVLAEHGGTRGAVLFIDLDDFKTVNDTLGHAAGDDLLLEVAERVRRCCTAADTVARLGGDEFAVLLPRATAPDDATRVARQILTALEPTTRIAGELVEIRASIGIASVSPGTNAETLMRDADTAMYQAKAQGKNQHVIFHRSMYESSLRRYNLHTDLRLAVDRNELCVYYQPIIALDTRRVVGGEALVRWNHPTLGLLTPDNFLHVAAETGLIASLDMGILDEACGWLAQVDAVRPGAVPMINVNLSPNSFREPGLATRILTTLRRHSLTPDRLCIEVTENLMEDETDQVVDILHTLQAESIRIALDDFGTGYSSLSHLRTLPIDTIKIPKPFVDDLGSPGDPDEPEARPVFATAIIALGQALDKRVVAEGIERPEQLETLRKLGCDHGQGYLIARPMDHITMQAWLRNQAGATPLEDPGHTPRLAATD
ncbi:MAG: putative bifunctional diguanylate cyclase/phosphodiesterase [Acidimicrobiales bacterium]